MLKRLMDRCRSKPTSLCLVGPVAFIHGPVVRSAELSGAQWLLGVPSHTCITQRMSQSSHALSSRFAVGLRTPKPEIGFGKYRKREKL